MKKQENEQEDRVEKSVILLKALLSLGISRLFLLEFLLTKGVVKFKLINLIFRFHVLSRQP